MTGKVLNQGLTLPAHGDVTKNIESVYVAGRVDSTYTGQFSPCFMKVHYPDTHLSDLWGNAHCVIYGGELEKAKKKCEKKAKGSCGSH